MHVPVTMSIKSCYWCSSKCTHTHTHTHTQSTATNNKWDN